MLAKCKLLTVYSRYDITRHSVIMKDNAWLVGGFVAAVTADYVIRPVAT